MLLMGIVKLPNHNMYWSLGTCNRLIADNTRNRLDDILSMLHFNGIPLIDDIQNNSFYKVQTLVDVLRKQFIETVLPERYHSVNEQMIPFKDRSRLRKYLPKKPKKWGCKVSVDFSITLKLTDPS